MKARLDLRALAADRPVHFMGVGGAGMYPLAELLLRSGGKVSGCDTKDSAPLRDLEALGAEVSVGHDETHVADAAALVVTAAVPSDHRQSGLSCCRASSSFGCRCGRPRPSRS